MSDQWKINRYNHKKRKNRNAQGTRREEVDRWWWWSERGEEEWSKERNTIRHIAHTTAHKREDNAARPILVSVEMWHAATLKKNNRRWRKRVYEARARKRALFMNRFTNVRIRQRERQTKPNEQEAIARMTRERERGKSSVIISWFVWWPSFQSRSLLLYVQKY